MPARPGMHEYQHDPSFGASIDAVEQRTAARLLARVWLSWEERYKQHPMLFGGAPGRWLRTQMDAVPARSRFLVLGAGEGRNALYLARAGHVVTAVDISATAIGPLRDAADEEAVSVETIVGDAVRWLESFSAQRRWDAVVLNCFSAGSPGDDERTLRLLSSRATSMIAELARGIVTADLVLSAWGEARLSYAHAKVPVLRIHR